MQHTQTYYDKEFAHLGTLPATMKIQNEKGETRWITVSPSEIEAILAVLNDKEAKNAT